MKLQYTSNMNIDALLTDDEQLLALVHAEQVRQQDTVSLIASESIALPQIRALQGSIFTNKYAEGYPHKRYYAGCAVSDAMESLAIERACETFGARYANVQAHAGSQANMAAYMAVLTAGDCILSMELSHGGHLTHGSSVNFSGVLYNIVHYGVNDTEYIDYDLVRELALKHRPRLIVCGASSYSQVIDFKIFRSIADEVGAYLLADIAHIAGLVAAKVHPSPFPYADIVTSTTHKTLLGPRGGIILCNDETLAERINSSIFPGMQGGPLMHAIAAKAYCFAQTRTAQFQQTMQLIVDNAAVMADYCMNNGFHVLTGGTVNHLFTLDLNKSGCEVSGKAVQTRLERIGISCNRNTVPFDTRSPFITSGVRLGTPIVSQRGMQAEQMKLLASWVMKLAQVKKADDALIKQLSIEVAQLCTEFPIPF